MIRSTLFWLHLACGVICGLVVFTMSFTGVLLTYERQIKAWVAEGKYAEPAPGQPLLPLETLIERQLQRDPAFSPATVVLTNAAGAPVSLRAGRQAAASLNPYTAEVMQTSSPALDAFFSWNTGFHRWFNVEGENRAIARQITGVSNVAFLFLVLSGMYLWLPRFCKWSQLRVRLLFNKAYPDSKARDFHWHHIFGIWAALPLAAVVYTAAVISYPWAANLMYFAFDADMPVAQGGAPGQGSPGAAGPGPGGAAPAAPFPLTLDPPQLSLAVLVEKALAHRDSDWKRLTVTLPKAADSSVQIEIDDGNGAQAHRRQTLTLDRSSGEVLAVRDFGDQPLAQRLRGIARFLHTGEILGFWGQTLAGLVSFASLFLVWTGLALSWRRLIAPLLRKRKAAAATTGKVSA
jgi:uncharacterized iron-regulated membrane protein